MGNGEMESRDWLDRRSLQPKQLCLSLLPVAVLISVFFAAHRLQKISYDDGQPEFDLYQFIMLLNVHFCNLMLSASASFILHMVEQ